MPAHSRPLAPALALLFNALVWGLTWFPFKALEANGVHPLWGTFVVYVGAAGLLLAWQPAALAALVRHPALLLLALAAGLTNIGFNWAVTIGDVVRVVLLFYLMPVWSLLLGRWLLQESITRGALARIGLAVAGALVVLWEPGTKFPVPGSLADWLGLAGGASFAFVNVLVRRHRDAPDDVRALAMFVGGFVVACAIAWTLSSASIIAMPPAPQWHWIAGTAALAIALLAGNLALQYGAARVPASVTAIVMLTEVLFAAISSMALGGETLDARTIAGGAMILGAAVLASSKRNGGGEPIRARGVHDAGQRQGDPH